MAGSLSASWTCQECKRRRQGAKHRTATGRVICGPCQRGLDAAALGVMTSDSVPGAVGTAVGISGIRDLLRRWLGRKD